MKKKLISLLQLALGVGLIVFLFYRMDNKADLLEALRAIKDNWPYLAGAILCFLVCLTVAAWRWRMILVAHGMPLSMWRALELYFIGHFFNAFMFGAVGGDLVKVFFVAKAIPHKRTEAVTTVFIDRLVGLLALVALAATVVILRYRFFMRYPETRAVMVFMIGVTLATIIGLFVVFRRNVFEHWAFFRRLEENTALGKTISRVYNAFHDCFTHRGLLARTLSISLVNHVALVFAAFLLGLGLNIQTADCRPQTTDCRPETSVRPFREFANYLTVFPIINGIAAIPATPGGLGTREYATQFLLGVPEFGVPATRAIPLSLLLYGATLFWSIIGGIVYALHALRAGKPTGEELESLA
jgi:uncharacterized protein (TIRG00374 family)